MQVLSTPSARRATPDTRGNFETTSISIHALREEGDIQASQKARPQRTFLSTPSARRATIRKEIKSCWINYFYPRPPRGGRPGCTGIVRPMLSISIHALREEGDYPDWSKSLMDTISIHALREEGDK